jgi:hypothetical protein
LTHLKRAFDIDFFFDDTAEFREAAKSLFIPGVYPSIAAYTGNEERQKGKSKKARKNPVSSAFAEDFAYEQPSLQNPSQVAPSDPSYRANPVPKPRKKRTKSGSMRKEPLKKYIERFMSDKKMNKEFPDRSQRFAVAATTARKFYGDKTVDKAFPRDNPRTNPHTPVHEAKTFYKKFHQKPAKNVKKTKVDIGDTWVGLGKAWSIGYRSGKETGNESQKYIHNFGVDEESGKQFKEPELYYVKNNDGSQMMVIMGGDWYIDVDEAGQMSWIYI